MGMDGRASNFRAFAPLFGMAPPWLAIQSAFALRSLNALNLGQFAFVKAFCSCAGMGPSKTHGFGEGNTFSDHVVTDFRK